MAKLKLVDMKGDSHGEIEVSDAIFNADVNENLLWEVVRWQRAKRRAGTAKVKERNEVHGTNAKMYKQKGTGNARHGSKRVNLWRGGGQVHGPRPRSYEFHVNRKAVAGALRSALSLRAQQNAVYVVKDMNVPDAKTKTLATALLALEASRPLLVDAGSNESLRRSSRNLPHADFLDVRGLNVYDILRHKQVLISEQSLREIEARMTGAAADSTEGDA